MPTFTRSRTTEDNYLVEVEVPGVHREGISIEVVGNELTISGEFRERERTGLRSRTRRTGNPELRKRVLTGSGVAPELLDLEAASVIRKLVLRGEIAVAEAGEALGDIRDCPVARIPHRPLVERVWELRDTLTAYDAAYVALAELFGAPLLTCDAKLARATSHHAETEFYAMA